MPKAKILKPGFTNLSALRSEEWLILNVLHHGAACLQTIQASAFPLCKGTYETRRFPRRVVEVGLVKNVSKGKYRLAPETRRMMARALLGMENVRDK